MIRKFVVPAAISVAAVGAGIGIGVASAQTPRPACHNNGTTQMYMVVTTDAPGDYPLPCEPDHANHQSLDVYLDWGTTVEQGLAYASLHGGALRLVVTNVDY